MIPSREELIESAKTVRTKNELLERFNKVNRCFWLDSLTKRYNIPDVSIYFKPKIEKYLDINNKFECCGNKIKINFKSDIKKKVL